jgi:hypothetical protein
LYDLLSAYASQRQRTVLSRVRFQKRTVWSLAEARATLERMIGQRQNGNLVQIDLLLARQREQKIERTFEAFDVDDHRRLAVAAIGLERHDGLRGIELLRRHEPVILCKLR